MPVPTGRTTAHGPCHYHRAPVGLRGPDRCHQAQKKPSPEPRPGKADKYQNLSGVGGLNWVSYVFPGNNPYQLGNHVVNTGLLGEQNFE